MHSAITEAILVRNLGDSIERSPAFDATMPDCEVSSGDLTDESADNDSTRLPVTR